MFLEQRHWDFVTILKNRVKFLLRGDDAYLSVDSYGDFISNTWGYCKSPSGAN